MTPLVLALPGNDQLAQRLAEAVGSEMGVLVVRRFPDGETYLRVDSPCANRDVLLVCSLARPDDKLPALLFAAAAIRELDARRISLVAQSRRPLSGVLASGSPFPPGRSDYVPVRCRAPVTACGLGGDG